MNVGLSCTQNSAQSVYTPKRNGESNGLAALGSFKDCIKTLRLRNEHKIIRFNPYTLEVKEVIDTEAAKKTDPAYKKLKEAGLIKDEEEDKSGRFKTFDENLLNTIRWHYANILAIKKAREAAVKIEEDTLEELFDHMESSAEGEPENTGVTSVTESDTDTVSQSNSVSDTASDGDGKDAGDDKDT